MDQRLPRSVEFGAWVRRVRQGLGLTRARFAARTSISWRELLRIETGRLSVSETVAVAIIATITSYDESVAAKATLHGEAPASTQTLDSPLTGVSPGEAARREKAARSTRRLYRRPSRVRSLNSLSKRS